MYGKQEDQDSVHTVCIHENDVLILFVVCYILKLLWTVNFCLG